LFAKDPRKAGSLDTEVLMIRFLALAVLAMVAAPGAAAIPTASGTAVLMPAGARLGGVSASVVLPVTTQDPAPPLVPQTTDKNVPAANRQLPCL